MRIEEDGLLRRLGIFVSALLITLLAAGAGAQTIVGTVGGVVTDASGAMVPGAKVTLQNIGTNESREFTTDSAGVYSFPSLSPGTYTVTVEMSGFSPYRATAISVNPGATSRVDAHLTVGSQGETVNVSASQVALQTDSAEVRGVLDTKQLQSLPIPANRNYQSALLLIPGVTPPVNAQSVAANPSRGLQFNTNGAMSNSNNVRIDGATANNVWLPHVAAYNPGLEAIDSVNVVTNSFDAQQGLAGGASVNVHVKTGTNSLHGSLFWFHADNVLTAKPFFLPTGFTRNPKNVDNTVGGTVGGPIKKDKVFFFGSYEGHFISQIASVFTTVPTADMRAGNFGASPTTLYDPDTGNPADGTFKSALQGNQVAAGRQDKIALAIQQHIPLPNLPGTANNYYATGRYHLATSHVDGNVTAQPTDKLHVGARLGVQHFNNFDAPAFGDNGVPVSSAGGRQGTAFGTVWNGTGSASYIFTPNFVFDGYFGATAIDTNATSVGIDQNVGLNLGIPNTNGPTQDYGGWPAFNITSFTAVGTNNGPIHYADREYQAQPSFSWTHGSHNIRFGGNVTRQIISHFEAGVTAGVFNFTGAATSNATTDSTGKRISGPPSNLYNAYADFLLGRVNTANSELLPDNNRLIGKSWIYSLFAQDQWIASSNLSLNYGLRWDYFPIGGRENRGFERYDFTNNTMEICGVAGNPQACGSKVSALNFSPSFGVSYKISPTFVIRAGVGLNKDPYPLTFNRDLVTNFPEDLTATLTSATSTLSTNLLDNGLPTVVPFDLSSGRVNVPGNYVVRALPTKVRRSYVETWNLSLEKELPFGMSGQVRYVGLRQLQISSLLNVNSSLPGTGNAGLPLNTPAFNNRTAATYLITPVGRNQYDGLQAQLSKRAEHNFSFTVGYTWSKTFAFCCDTIAGETVSVQAPGFLGLNRALAVFDRPYVLTVSGTAASPFGHNQKWATGRVGSALLGGWQLNGILASYSGTPFTISAAANSLNASGSSQQADRVRTGACVLGAYHGANSSYVDPTCYASVTDARFGTAGFNSVRGPGVKNLNASLFRRFNFTDIRALEFRAEVFNVTNTPHFANPGNTNISNVIFNPDRTVASLNGFGSLTSTNARDQEGVDQRQIRVGAKFTF